MTRTGGGTLRTRRLHTHVRVARGHPAPERVRSTIAAAAGTALPAALAHTLATRFGTNDDTIWRIRRLEVELTVNAAWEPTALARVWAARIALAVTRALDEGDCENVVRFAGPSQHLAAFLTDVIDGVAWTRWYHDAFAGFLGLPASAAVRSALLRRPEVGLAALYEMPRRTRTRVIAALTDTDVRRVMHGLATTGPARDRATAVRAVAAALEHTDNDEDAGARRALRLFIEAAQGEASRRGPALADAANAIVRLRRRISEEPPTRLQLLRRALEGGDAAALWRLVGEHDAEVLAPLAGLEGTVLDAVFEAAQPPTTQSPVRDATADVLIRTTPFGGAFILLPFVEALPLAEAVRGWPDCAGIPAVRLTRFLVLLSGLGAVRAERAFHDPLLRDLLGISPSLDLDEVARWHSQIGGRRAAAFAETLLRHARDRGAVTDDAVVEATVRYARRTWRVEIDAARGLWLRADRLPRGTQPGTPVVIPAGAAHTDAVAAVSARTDRLGEELAFVMLPRRLRGPGMAPVLAVAAQHVLRDFAWRLPGFARSTLPHLFANFLDAAATVESATDAHVVHLGRPPLGLILDLSGLSRARYTLSGEGARPVRLFPESGR